MASETDDPGTSSGIAVNDEGDQVRHRPPRRRQPEQDGGVVVVGPCASGKSTLVQALTSMGYRARVCGQEHSDVATLWRRGRPAFAIVLDIDLDTLRARRGAGWSEPMLARQRRRLADARAAADLVIDVSRLSEAAVLAKVLRAIEDAIQPGSGRRLTLRR